MKRLFLFDLDGTLVSTGGAGMRALSKTFSDLYGVADAASRISPSGKTDPAILRELARLFLGRDLDAAELERVSNAYLAHLEREMAAPVAKGPLAGVVDLVRHLSGHPDAVLSLGTGNLEPGARIKLAPFDLNRFFPDGGFGSDSEDRADLLRFGHRRAERRAGQPISPERVFVIGDTVLDVAAAQRAGFRAVAVASGGSTFEALAATAPDHLMRSLSEGFDWLRQLEAGAAA